MATPAPAAAPADELKKHLEVCSALTKKDTQVNEATTERLRLAADALFASSSYGALGKFSPSMPLKDRDVFLKQVATLGAAILSARFSAATPGLADVGFACLQRCVAVAAFHVRQVVATRLAAAAATTQTTTASAGAASASQSSTGAAAVPTAAAGASAPAPAAAASGVRTCGDASADFVEEVVTFLSAVFDKGVSFNRFHGGVTVSPPAPPAAPAAAAPAGDAAAAPGAASASSSTDGVVDDATWRAGLKASDCIDFYHDKARCWMTAVVSEVAAHSGLVRVTCSGVAMPTTVWYSRHDAVLQQPDSRVQPGPVIASQPWRCFPAMTLGTNVDILDSLGRWGSGRVVDIRFREGLTATEIIDSVKVEKDRQAKADAAAAAAAAAGVGAGTGTAESKDADAADAASAGAGGDSESTARPPLVTGDSNPTGAGVGMRSYASVAGSGSGGLGSSLGVGPIFTNNMVASGAGGASGAGAMATSNNPLFSPYAAVTPAQLAERASLLASTSPTDPIDEVRIQAEGYGIAASEWVSVRSPRLAQYRAMAGGKAAFGIGDFLALERDDETNAYAAIIDDADLAMDDPAALRYGGATTPPPPAQDDAAAAGAAAAVPPADLLLVPMPPLAARTGMRYGAQFAGARVYDNITLFAAAGGIDALVTRLQLAAGAPLALIQAPYLAPPAASASASATAPWSWSASLSTLCGSLSALACCVPYTSRPYLLTFAHPARWAACAALARMSDAHLRAFASLDQMKVIGQGVYRLCARVAASGVVSGYLEQASLDFALALLRCGLITQRLLGVKLLADACSAARLNRSTYFTPEAAVRWITESRVLEMLYTGDALATAALPSSGAVVTDASQLVYLPPTSPVILPASMPLAGVATPPGAGDADAPSEPVPAPAYAPLALLLTTLRLKPRPSHAELVRRTDGVLRVLFSTKTTTGTTGTTGTAGAAAAGGGDAGAASAASSASSSSSPPHESLLEALWTVTRDESEAMSSAAWHVLEEATFDLPKGVINFFVTRVGALPLVETADAGIIGIMKKWCKHGQHAGAVTPAALEVLWRLALPYASVLLAPADGSGSGSGASTPGGASPAPTLLAAASAAAASVPLPLQQAAVDACFECLDGYANKDKRLPAMVRLLAVIKADAGAHTAIGLLRRLIDSFSLVGSSAPGDLARGKAIGTLEEEHGLTTVLLDELERYKRAAAAAAVAAGVVSCTTEDASAPAAAAAAGTGSGSATSGGHALLTPGDLETGRGVKADGGRVDLNALVPIPHERGVTHLSHVTSRVSFFKWVVLESALRINYAQAKRIYDCLYVRGLTRAERRIALELLTAGASQQHGASLVCPDVIPLFFDRVLVPAEDAALAVPVSALMGALSRSASTQEPAAADGGDAAAAAAPAAPAAAPAAFSFSTGKYTAFLPVARSAVADAIGMTRPGFELLRAAILDVHSRISAAVSRVSESDGECQTDPRALAGINHVWRVALLAEDDSVATTALAFLTSLHTRFHPSLEDKGPTAAASGDASSSTSGGNPCRPIVEGYVGRVLYELNAAAKVLLPGAAGGSVQEAPRPTDAPPAAALSNPSLSLRIYARSMGLLTRLLDHSDARGYGLVLRPHAARVRGAATQLVVTNALPAVATDKIPFQADCLPATFSLHAYASSTVWDLRVAVAVRSGIPPPRVALSRTRAANANSGSGGGGSGSGAGAASSHYGELTDAMNARTLQTLGIRPGDTLTLSVKSDHNSRPLPLIIGAKGTGVDGWKATKLTPGADAAFRAMFAKYADKGAGGVTKDGFVAFVKFCGATIPTARLNELFTANETNEKGAMTEGGWVSFYHEACIRAPEFVRNDLSKHGFDDRFVFRQPAAAAAKPAAASPASGGGDSPLATGKSVAASSAAAAVLITDARPMIAGRPDAYSALLAMLSLPPSTGTGAAGEAAVASTWALLLRLPTSPALLRALSLGVELFRREAGAPRSVQALLAAHAKAQAAQAAALAARAAPAAGAAAGDDAPATGSGSGSGATIPVPVPPPSQPSLLLRRTSSTGNEEPAAAPTAPAAGGGSHLPDWSQLLSPSSSPLALLYVQQVIEGFMRPEGTGNDDSAATVGPAPAAGSEESEGAAASAAASATTAAGGALANAPPSPSMKALAAPPAPAANGGAGDKAGTGKKEGAADGDKPSESGGGGASSGGGGGASSGAASAPAPPATGDAGDGHVPDISSLSGDREAAARRAAAAGGDRQVTQGADGNISVSIPAGLALAAGTDASGAPPPLALDGASDSKSASGAPGGSGMGGDDDEDEFDAALYQAAFDAADRGEGDAETILAGMVAAKRAEKERARNASGKGTGNKGTGVSFDHAEPADAVDVGSGGDSDADSDKAASGRKPVGTSGGRPGSPYRAKEPSDDEVEEGEDEEIDSDAADGEEDEDGQWRRPRPAGPSGPASSILDKYRHMGVEVERQVESDDDEDMYGVNRTQTAQPLEFTEEELAAMAGVEQAAQARDDAEGMGLDAAGAGDTPSSSASASSGAGPSSGAPAPAAPSSTSYGAYALDAADEYDDMDEATRAAIAASLAEAGQEEEAARIMGMAPRPRGGRGDYGGLSGGPQVYVPSGPPPGALAELASGVPHKPPTSEPLDASAPAPAASAPAPADAGAAAAAPAAAAGAAAAASGADASAGKPPAAPTGAAAAEIASALRDLILTPSVLVALPTHQRGIGERLTAAAACQWRARFVASGGFKHLVAALAGNNSSTADAAAADAASGSSSTSSGSSGQASFWCLSQCARLVNMMLSPALAAQAAQQAAAAAGAASSAEEEAAAAAASAAAASDDAGILAAGTRHHAPAATGTPASVMSPAFWAALPGYCAPSTTAIETVAEQMRGALGAAVVSDVNFDALQGVVSRVTYQATISAAANATAAAAGASAGGSDEEALVQAAEQCIQLWLGVSLHKPEETLLELVHLQMTARARLADSFSAATDAESASTAGGASSTGGDDDDAAGAVPLDKLILTLLLCPASPRIRSLASSALGALAAKLTGSVAVTPAAAGAAGKWATQLLPSSAAGDAPAATAGGLVTTAREALLDILLLELPRVRNAHPDASAATGSAAPVLVPAHQYFATVNRLLRDVCGLSAQQARDKLTRMTAVKARSGFTNNAAIVACQAEIAALPAKPRAADSFVALLQYLARRVVTHTAAEAAVYAGLRGLASAATVTVSIPETATSTGSSSNSSSSSSSSSSGASGSGKGGIAVQEDDEVLVGIMMATTTLLEAYPSLRAVLTGGASASSASAGGAAAGSAAVVVSPPRAPLARSASSVAAEDLVRVIFTDCLFKLPTEEDALAPGYDPTVAAPKCVRSRSRATAYKLLVRLCDSAPGAIVGLVSSLSDVLKSVTRLSGYFARPNQACRSGCGYVGLNNPGCVCYMLSALQQLFMIPYFRYGILATWNGQPIFPAPPAAALTNAGDASKPAPGAFKLPALQSSTLATVLPTGEEEAFDDNFFQLQRLMGFLALSDRRDYGMRPFVFSYKDYAGNPTPIGEQQDSNEFVTAFMDRIETHLKGTAMADLLQHVCSGSQVYSKRCKKCGTVTEREEPFVFIKLEIAHPDIDDVSKALNDFTKEEHLEGIDCDVCAGKSDVVRRPLISKLPNTLILNLNRLTFSYDTMMREKLNKRVAFPVELNVKQYCKAGVAAMEKSQAAAAAAAPAAGAASPAATPSAGGESGDVPTPLPTTSPAGGAAPAAEDDDTPFKYRLVGVVIHRGTAESGHYFSYIMDRATGKWHEYNDSITSPFDINKLEEACFGGVQESTYMGPYGYPITSKLESSESAYMCFYEKVSLMTGAATADADADGFQDAVNLYRVAAGLPPLAVGSASAAAAAAAPPATPAADSTEPGVAGDVGDATPAAAGAASRGAAPAAAASNIGAIGGAAFREHLRDLTARLAKSVAPAATDAKAASGDAADEEEAAEEAEGTVTAVVEGAGATPVAAGGGSSNPIAVAAEIARATIPRPIYRAAAADNIRFARDRCVYASEFTGFMADMMGAISRSISGPPGFSTTPLDPAAVLGTTDIDAIAHAVVDVGLTFAVDIAARMDKSSESVRAVCRHISKVLTLPGGDILEDALLTPAGKINRTAAALACSRRLLVKLVSTPAAFTEVLTSCPEESIRRTVGGIISSALITVLSTEREQKALAIAAQRDGVLEGVPAEIMEAAAAAAAAVAAATAPAADGAAAAPPPPSSLSIAAVGALLAMAPDAGKSWSRMGEYWQCVSTVAKATIGKVLPEAAPAAAATTSSGLSWSLGSIVQPLTAFMLAAHRPIVANVLNMILGAESPLAAPGAKHSIPSIGASAVPPPWSNALEIIAAMVLTMDAQGFPMSSMQKEPSGAPAAPTLQSLLTPLPAAAAAGAAAGSSGGASVLRDVRRTLTQNEEGLLAQTALWTRCLAESIGTGALVRITKHVSWYNSACAPFFTHVMCTGLAASSIESVAPFVEMIRSVVAQKDFDLTTPAGALRAMERVACVLGDPHFGTCLAGVGMGLSRVAEEGAPGADGELLTDATVRATIPAAGAAPPAPDRQLPPSWEMALPYYCEGEDLATMAGRNAYLGSIGLRAGSGILRAIRRRRPVDDRPVMLALAELLKIAEGCPPLAIYLFRLPALEPSSEDRYADWIKRHTLRMWEQTAAPPGGALKLGPLALPDAAAPAAGAAAAAGAASSGSGGIVIDLTKDDGPNNAAGGSNSAFDDLMEDVARLLRLERACLLLEARQAAEGDALDATALLSLPRVTQPTTSTATGAACELAYDPYAPEGVAYPQWQGRAGRWLCYDPALLRAMKCGRLLTSTQDQGIRVEMYEYTHPYGYGKEEDAAPDTLLGATPTLLGATVRDPAALAERPLDRVHPVLGYAPGSIPAEGAAPMPESPDRPPARRAPGRKHVFVRAYSQAMHTSQCCADLNLTFFCYGAGGEAKFREPGETATCNYAYPQVEFCKKRLRAKEVSFLMDAPLISTDKPPTFHFHWRFAATMAADVEAAVGENGIFFPASEFKNELYAPVAKVGGPLALAAAAAAPAGAAAGAGGAAKPTAGAPSAAHVSGTKRTFGATDMKVDASTGFDADFIDMTDEAQRMFLDDDAIGGPNGRRPRSGTDPHGAPVIGPVNRPQATQSAARSGEWDCGVCTFHNPSYLTRCEMCDAPKSAGGNPTDYSFDTS